jgi:tight adherence protein B
MGLMIFHDFLGRVRGGGIAAVRGRLRAPHQKAKQVQATLDSALAPRARRCATRLWNLRKNEQLSAIPWINNRLLQTSLAPQLQALIHQANLKWTAGGLMLMCGALFCIPAFVIHWKTGQSTLSLGPGWPGSSAHSASCCSSAAALQGSLKRELPEACDLMVSALRAGHSLIAAMGLVSRECPTRGRRVQNLL